MNIPVALAVSAAVLLAASAPAASAADAPPAAKAPAPARACFWTRNANGFAAVDEHTLNVRVNSRDVFQFEMFGTCRTSTGTSASRSSRAAAPTSAPGWTPRWSPTSPIGPQRCPVRSVRKLTPAEVAALPPRARP